ncbi:hypothetical protein [Terrabacter sp. NPDC000476]|uniref:hypothetical protein n=1 Tax=Terrabacter sp. NPDC000476 TaxID=3154258 RepID=UPI0033257FBF
MRRAPAAGALGLVALVLAGAVALGGCSSGSPAVELSQVVGSTGTPAPPRASTVAPPSTVVVTHVDTVTVTVTSTAVRTTTVVATPAVTVTVLPRPALTTTRVFDRASAVTDYTALVADVAALDRMPVVGAAAAVRLDELSRRLARLEANGPPPGVDPPSYYGRVGSLRLFADAASGEAAASSPVAVSRYAVIRQETVVLLSVVNGALSTTFTVPPAPPAPVTPSPRASPTPR